MQEVYKTWTISVKDKVYKIIGFEPDRKAHVLYSGVGTCTGKRDEYGDMLFNEYESDEQAMEKAKAYIDLYAGRLEKYLSNRIEKRMQRKQDRLKLTQES